MASMQRSRCASGSGLGTDASVAIRAAAGVKAAAGLLFDCGSATISKIDRSIRSGTAHSMWRPGGAVEVPARRDEHLPQYARDKFCCGIPQLMMGFTDG
ncbi:hypothetical protein [Streptomyces sp. NPDC048590]|uniref:hypothetical protein n=1 Tax=Streptomyces sp. NPDC048590 TaxID=3365574 RepID=UPI00371EFD1D